MSNYAHPQSSTWKIFVLILGAIALVSCGNPVPSAVAMTRVSASITPTVARATQTTPVTEQPIFGNIIPRPVSEIPAGGSFRLLAQTGIYVEPETSEMRAIGQYFSDLINPSTGFTLKVQGTKGMPAQGNIYLTLSGAAAMLGDEGYELTITPELIKLAANQPAGLFHGLQTIRQLLPAAIENSTLQSGPWVLGTGTITDYPRYTWRGAMLDVARHFFSVKDVTRYIDLLAYYKINRLHLHLTDDQGWRIQINSWPNLALYGGSLEVGGTPGGYYSQDDFEYIVNYAQLRYITVVPEIDVPSHTNAALASYPELNCDGVAPELYTGTRVGFSSLCVPKDITYTFMEDVIAELAALTPGPYLHIGGDEAQSTSQADYINFFQQVQPIVERFDKQVVGWDEIAQAKLLPASIVQYWNLDKGFAVQALAQGAKFIMSPADKAYMDMKYQASTSLGQDWAGYITLETGYSWDPVTEIDGLTEKNILGVEAPLWSETLNTMDDLEYMAFPRLPGYAEIGWTPQAGREWNEYKSRLAAHGPRLEVLGVHFYRSPEVTWP